MSCLCRSCSLRRVAPYMPSDAASVRVCWALYCVVVAFLILWGLK